MARSDRRNFLAELGGWVAGGVALALLPAGCDQQRHLAPPGATDEDEDDFGMHGPVAQATELLERPDAVDALALFAPYDSGEPFLRRWAIAHVTRGQSDQIVIVMEDLETGGHAEVELYALEATVDPVAFSDLYAVIVDNGGRGDKQTPLHLRRLAERIAEIVAGNEHAARLSWSVPTLPEASARWHAQIVADRGEG